MSLTGLLVIAEVLKLAINNVCYSSRGLRSAGELQHEYGVPRWVHLKLLREVVAIKMHRLMVVHNDPGLWEGLDRREQYPCSKREDTFILFNTCQV